jgi:hypothetical protein
MTFGTSFRRTSSLRTSGLLGSTAVAVAAVGLAGCSSAEDGTDWSDAVTARLSDEPDSALGVPPTDIRCAGQLVRGVPLRMPATERQLDQWVCLVPGSNRVETTWLDERGRHVNIDEENSVDALAFRVRDHRMHKGLAGELAARRSEEIVEADVWLAVDRPEMPEREDIIQDRAIRERYYAALRVAYAAAASRLAADIRALAIGIEVQPYTTEGTLVPRPFVTIRAPAMALPAVGDLDSVLLVANSVRSETATATPTAHETYYDVDGIPTLNNAGRDGTGITVAIVEGSRWDQGVVNLGAPTGSCSAGGTSYRCACPSSLRVEAHPRWTGGTVCNVGTSLRGGTAHEATLVSANWDDDVQGCTFEHAVDWAIQQGASVLNYSMGGCQSAAAQSATDKYWDFIAGNYPNPFVAASAGNDGLTLQACHTLANGLVVGGGDNSTAARSSYFAMYSTSMSKNWGGAHGWEMPHIVAPAVNIDLVGATPTTHDHATGNSLSTPQVSGVAAALQEQVPTLKYWPEAIMAILMVAPERGVPGDNTWPMSLRDGVDDQDGVGPLHGAYSMTVAGRRVHGSYSAAPEGWDSGGTTPTQTPQFTLYPEVYNVWVTPGKTLRAAFVTTATSNCNPLDQLSCTTNTWPKLGLLLYDEQGQTLKFSFNYNGNYQYLSWTESEGRTRYLTLRFYPADWVGFTYASFALAWGSWG